MSMIIIWTVGIINHVQFHSCSNSCFFFWPKVLCPACVYHVFSYRKGMLPVQPITFFTLQVSTLPAVDWATSCLGQILRIGPLGSQNIQFANPVGCAGWCNSEWKLRWEDASSTNCHEAIWEWSIYISIYSKGFISSISTSGTVSHINIIVVHAKGQHWSNSKTSMHATRKVLWPSTTSVNNMQKTIYVDVHLYICCRLWTINNEYNANTVCI